MILREINIDEKQLIFQQFTLSAQGNPWGKDNI